MKPEASPVIHSLRYWDIKLGFGKNTVQPGDEVGIIYRTMLLNKSIKQIYKFTEPFIFQIGMGQVMPGLEACIIGMRVGGIREMLIPPEYAFGKKGCYHKYPPHRIIHARVKLLHLNRIGLPKGMKYTPIEKTDLTPYLDPETDTPKIGVRFRRPEKKPESEFELGLRLYKLYRPLPGAFLALLDRWWRTMEEWKRIELAPSYKRISMPNQQEFYDWAFERKAQKFKEFLALSLIDPQEEYSDIAQFELTLMPFKELLEMFIRRLGVIKKIPKVALDEETRNRLIKEREEAIKNFDIEQVKAKLDLVRTEETEDLLDEILQELQDEMTPFEPDTW